MTRSHRQPRPKATGVFLRVPDGLKDRVQTYARAHGLSDNAAGIVLLEAALDAAEAKDKTR